MALVEFMGGPQDGKKMHMPKVLTLIEIDEMDFELTERRVHSYRLSLRYKLEPFLYIYKGFRRLSPQSGKDLDLPYKEGNHEQGH